MDMCERKYMFGDKSTSQNMPKKGRQKNILLYIQQGPITRLYVCKHKDSNELGNHFHILSTRMVQSAELAWTVL